MLQLVSFLCTLHYTLASNTDFTRGVLGEGDTGFRIDELELHVGKDEPN